MLTSCLNVCVLFEHLLRYVQTSFALCVNIVCVCATYENRFRLYFQVQTRCKSYSSIASFADVLLARHATPSLRDGIGKYQMKEDTDADFRSFREQVTNFSLVSLA